MAILVAIVYVAAGHGGELSAERVDQASLELGPVSATDVALLRPPTALWGYNAQATDEALTRIAESIRERDVRIVALEQLVSDLSRESSPVARHRRAASGTERAESTPPVEPSAPVELSAPVEPADRTRPGGSGRPVRPGGEGFSAPPERSHG